MQVFLNEIELKTEITTDSLLELLRGIQEEVEKSEETIVKIVVDDIENSVDLSDEDSDISLDYIDKVDIFTEHINNVSANIITSFQDYFENAVNMLPIIADKLVTNDKVDAVDNIYQIVDGIKQMNIAFNSMSQMGKIDVDLVNETGLSLNDVLVKVNDVIIDVIEKIKEKKWDEAKDLIEFDFSLKVNELINFLPTLASQLKGEN